MEDHIILTGKKVILRAAERQDQGMLLGLIRDPRIVKVTKGYQYAASGVHPAHGLYFLPVPVGSFRRVIAERKKPEAGLGMILLSDIDEKSRMAQIHIKLLKSARDSGRGRDAVNVLTAYAFRQLGLDRICASILEDNLPSRKLFEACGFEQESTYESRADQEGHCRSVCCYVRRKEA